MQDTLKTLTKELVLHGIKLIGNNACECTYEGKKQQFLIKQKIDKINKDLYNNAKIFKELWDDVINLIVAPCKEEKLVVDIKTRNLFIESLKGLADFAEFLLPDYVCIFTESHIRKIRVIINNSIRRDLTSFNSDFMQTISSYRIAIDWMSRLVEQLMYVRRLLSFVINESKMASVMQIKLARGVQGPWGNLDLPLLERVFPWSDIEDEVRGRDRDIRKQTRYRMGLDNYNNDSVGSGFYWREIRNEPYSWSDRETASPYPGRNVLLRQ